MRVHILDGRESSKRVQMWPESERDCRSVNRLVDECEVAGFGMRPTDLYQVMFVELYVDVKTGGAGPEPAEHDAGNI